MIDKVLDNMPTGEELLEVLDESLPIAPQLQLLARLATVQALEEE